MNYGQLWSLFAHGETVGSVQYCRCSAINSLTPAFGRSVAELQRPRSGALQFGY
jgi:hypothetical protein